MFAKVSIILQKVVILTLQFSLMDPSKFYTKREETANWLTHFLGVLIGIAGTILLIKKAIEYQNNWAILAFSIFGFGILACMLASTIYHYVQTLKTKALLRHFDHGSIYVLIASSYSPFTLILLRNEGFWGWGLFILVWIIAFVGIGFNFGKLKANSHWKTASYVLMGLLIIVAIQPSIKVASATNSLNVLLWILIGGVFYIAGAVIYALAKREFSHAVFHVFVLLGLVSHIWAAWLVPL